MKNSYFAFRQFTIHQERCAMKVGTDGTLLGAWAHGGQRILDVGTGTGLIALMMAQKNVDARVTAIDIDESAVEQAQQNVAASPFANRVEIRHEDLAMTTGEYDAIVCNPPYFAQSLHCPDAQRTIARHDTTLTFAQLMSHAHRLLSDNGELSVVVPSDCRQRMESEAALAGFFKSRECSLQTTARKPPRRWLLAYTKHPTASVEHDALTIGSERCNALTAPFYLD